MKLVNPVSSGSENALSGTSGRQRKPERLNVGLDSAMVGSQDEGGSSMDQQAFSPYNVGALAVPMIFVGLIATAILVIPYWFIFKKAGFSPWLALLMLVPLVNILVLYVFAFSAWKVAPVGPYSVTPMRHEPYPPQS
jgi:hypothetical protein